MTWLEKNTENWRGTRCWYRNACILLIFKARLQFYLKQDNISLNIAASGKMTEKLEKSLAKTKKSYDIFVSFKRF